MRTYTLRFILFARAQPGGLCKTLRYIHEFLWVRRSVLRSGRFGCENRRTSARTCPQLGAHCGRDHGYHPTPRPCFPGGIPTVLQTRTAETVEHWESGGLRKVLRGSVEFRLLPPCPAPLFCGPFPLCKGAGCSCVNFVSGAWKFGRSGMGQPRVAGGDGGGGGVLCRLAGCQRPLCLAPSLIAGLYEMRRIFWVRRIAAARSISPTETRVDSYRAPSRRSRARGRVV